MAYAHRPCDSYFLESHDGRRLSNREITRERERYLNQQTQLAIAEELSHLVSVEYCADVLEHMEAMEVDHFNLPNDLGYNNMLYR